MYYLCLAFFCYSFAVYLVDRVSCGVQTAETYLPMAEIFAPAEILVCDCLNRGVSQDATGRYVLGLDAGASRVAFFG